ncbi:MAG TPA: SPOR domain-containing protein [Rudaea sp.]|jgi:DedD protein
MDSALKQRLLGAAVLIALAIIFVPMFLGNSPPKEASAIQNLDIPALPERKFETRTLPIESATTAPAEAARPPAGGDKIVTVDTRAPATFEVPDTKPGDKTAETSVNAKVPAAAPAPESKPVAEAAKPVAVETPPPAALTAPGGRFSINLGVYADQGHADALVAKLKKAGFAAYSEDTEYQGKAAHRVRVGPYANRAAAESVRLRIKQREPRLPSSVSESSEQPAADAPASALAAHRAGGWAVQLGAFKSEAEANKLRDRVRGAGIAAFSERSGSGDQALWRVRAGPYADRPGAETARASIKAKLQSDGMIVTQP